MAIFKDAMTQECILSWGTRIKLSDLGTFYLTAKFKKIKLQQTILISDNLLLFSRNHFKVTIFFSISYIQLLIRLLHKSVGSELFSYYKKLFQTIKNSVKIYFNVYLD